MNIIKVRNLKKSFGDNVVFENLTFSVKKGSIFSIVGPSGSGKSTLGKIILGLEKYDSGEIYYKESLLEDLLKKNKKRFRREVQIILQNSSSSLNPRQKIKEILKEPFLIHKISFTDKSLVKLLEEVGLNSSFLNRYPREMSGGQRQRIAIARILTLRPELIILDEILRGLDLSLQGQLMNLILKIKKSYGFTIIMITHNKEIVDFLSDYILRLQNSVVSGKKQRIGTPPREDV